MTTTPLIHELRELLRFAAIPPDERECEEPQLGASLQDGCEVLRMLARGEAVVISVKRLREILGEFEKRNQHA